VQGRPNTLATLSYTNLVLPVPIDPAHHNPVLDLGLLFPAARSSKIRFQLCMAVNSLVQILLGGMYRFLSHDIARLGILLYLLSWDCTTLIILGFWVGEA